MMSLTLCVCLYGTFFFYFKAFKSIKARRLKGVSRVFQECFKSVSRVFQGCFKGVSRVFQGCFKGVSRVFQRVFQIMFKGCLKGV